MHSGDLFVTVKVSSRDEIGELSNSFNEMISIVRDARLQLEQKIEERTESLNQTILELRETQEQLLQAERMSTLGKIAASVAHEINNPLAAIKGSIQFIKDGQSNVPNPDKTENFLLAERFIAEFKNQKRSEVTSRFKRKKNSLLSLNQNPFPIPFPWQTHVLILKSKQSQRNTKNFSIQKKEEPFSNRS